MTYAKKVDENHKIIVQKFRELGASVFDASGVGRGFPDILVGFNNQTALVEIKSSDKKKFTEPQLKFMAEWKGSAVSRINDVQGADILINILKLQ